MQVRKKDGQKEASVVYICTELDPLLGPKAKLDPQYVRCSVLVATFDKCRRGLLYLRVGLHYSRGQ